MKPIMIVGLLLIAAGIAGLVFGQLSFVTETKVINLGPITASVDEVRRVPIPEIASLVAVAAGLALVFLGRRSN